jgi:hypothetical protein
MNELTNAEIALLCEIGEFNLPEHTSDHDLARLISDGYVERREGHPKSPFILTAKATEFLSARGATLNEG